MDSRRADSRGNGEYRFDGVDRKTDLEEGDAGAGGETEVVAEEVEEGEEAEEATGCGGGGGGGEGVNNYDQILLLHTTYMYEEQSGMRKMYRHNDRIPSWHLYAVLLSY